MLKRRIIQVKQNTKEWREWRDMGIGASDAPSIMGDSPWTSKFQLWAYKTGLMQRTEPNGFQVSAMKRGQDLEPSVREWYEAKTRTKFPATSFEHPEFPFLRASLDGFNAELNKNLEIKCPNKIDHKKAIDGFIPDKYKAQLEMQMMVSGAESTDYVSWDGKDSYALVQTVPDYEYKCRILNELLEFWHLVENKVPPVPSKKDLEAVSIIFRKSSQTLEECVKVFNLAFINKGERDK